jgi:methyl-accepting chemotaxis protein
VADEVRNLAQRSAQAAKDTQNLIITSLDKNKDSQQLFQIVSGLMAANSQVAQKVGQFLAEVSASVEQQSEGVNQINTAVTQMDKVTQSNAAGAEESASAAEELNAQSENMKMAVADLLAMIGHADNQNAVHISMPAPTSRKHTIVESHTPAFQHHRTASSPAASRSVAVVKNGRKSDDIPMDDFS